MDKFMTQSERGWAEIVEGVLNWRLWTRLGTQEVKRRYRRTMLGPFWSTASLGLFIFAMGITWAKLWGQDIKTYLPFVCSGMLVWTLVLGIITEGCGVFVASSGIITQFRIPYSLLACVVIWRNILLFFHNLIIFVLVAMLCKVPLSWAMLLVIPALAVIFANGVWVIIIVGFLCARYRDVQQLIGSVLQIGLFVTPIFWNASQLGNSLNALLMVKLNLLFHFIDIVRSPMMGVAPSGLSWVMTVGTTFVGWAFTLRLYAKFHRRLPYWL